MGEKWGAALGGIVGALLHPINMNKIKNPLTGLITTTGACALGGHWLGKITDNYTNKQSAKVADEQK